MGKPTGFMEYDREVSKAVEPKERIKNFDEFHIHLSKKKQEIQGSRCMACGVPFCQSGMTLMGMTSGCPLHNLVPEWNDLIYMGTWEQAYERLHKTNNFPEFTSRVCHVPAVCMMIRSPYGTMSTELLNMHMKKVMRRQIRQKCVQGKKWLSSDQARLVWP